MGAGLMFGAWGKSWGAAWGPSWGYAGQTNYSAAPAGIGPALRNPPGTRQIIQVQERIDDLLQTPRPLAAESNRQTDNESTRGKQAQGAARATTINTTRPASGAGRRVLH